MLPTESKACTLIAVLVVHNCHQAKVKFSLEKTCIENLINVFSESIKQGNKIYEKMRQSGLLKVKYLNIPEALIAVSSNTVTPVVEWDSFFYETDMFESLYHNLTENIQHWYKKRPQDVSSDLSVVILANFRAVVLIFSRKTGMVTLVDSHGHCPYGAVIALVPNSSLENLCKWYAKQLTRDTEPIPCYELSFLYCCHQKNSRS